MSDERDNWMILGILIGAALVALVWFLSTDAHIPCT